jgi:hypothetical protein
VLDALGFYRRLGFFESPKSDEEVAAWLERRIRARRRLYRDDASDYHHPDLELVSFDRRRTLDFDLECYYVGGRGLYRDELPRFARISRGGFRLDDVDEEQLAGADQPVRLVVTTDGAAHEYVLHGHGDWIDWKAFWVVEELTAGAARLHAAAEPWPSDAVYFVFLTPAEREEIRRERGLVFAPLPPDPLRPFEWWWLHQYWIELDAESRLLRSFGVTAYDEVDALELLRDEFVRRARVPAGARGASRPRPPMASEAPRDLVPGDQPDPAAGLSVVGIATAATSGRSARRRPALRSPRSRGSPDASTRSPAPTRADRTRVARPAPGAGPETRSRCRGASAGCSRPG